MVQAPNCAVRGKMIRPMVTFVVIYCVCVWSTVCFFYVEADPLPNQRQMNMNATSDNGEALSSGDIIGIVFGVITSITAIIGVIVGIIGIAKCSQRPLITQSPVSIKVAAGQKVELKCEASGKPAPNFQWLKDGCDVAGSDGVTITTGNGHSTLTINNIQDSHAGKYRCRAFNCFGYRDDISCPATITIAGPPTITQDPVASKAPVKSGLQASFTCKASSDLPMEFSWQKDGSSIFSSSITVKTSGNMSTLTLEHVSTTDAGSYTCTASNDAGSVTSNAATLQVTGNIIQKLKQAIPDNLPNWNPLPDCKSSVELAMIRVNRKEEQHQNTERVKNQVLGKVDNIMDSPGVVQVKACGIFDSGLFKDDSSIVLLQGGPGMGKTNLGYSYCKKWKDGGLLKFDMAAFVSLRETGKEKVLTFDDLLLLACRNDEVMKEELKHYVETGSSLLLVLDGWDEAPDLVRMSPDNFIDMIQRSIPSQSKSKILITSRPDSSVELDVNRVEIMGFFKDSIKEYFKEALRSSLNDEHEIEDGCKELENHLKTYPSIQSCCAIPLNAAIVTSLFLASDQKPRTLPRTRHELFSSIVAHLINIEQEKQCAYARKKLAVSHISCLEDLPDSLKKPLCRLAFDNLKEIVIPHEMVASTQLVEFESANPNCNDASFNFAKPILSPCLYAVLQTIEKRDPKLGGKMYYHHFIHLSIQELLAAYHISQLGEDEQVKVFEDLLHEPHFSSVLQFYAAFTRFTNQGVRDVVTRMDFADEQHILLTIMRCCFEANSQDQLLFQKISQGLNSRLQIFHVALTPFDCMSVGYFLAFALRAGELLSVRLESCSIDDHSLGLLLGELARHEEACPAGVLQGVTELHISNNNIGDDGIAHLATAFQANTTLKILDIGCDRGITVNGAKSLGRALSLNSSLEQLNISRTSIGDEGVAHIANALQKNTTIKLLDVTGCIGMSCKGAQSLGRALSVNSSLEKLHISSCTSIGDEGVADIAYALQTNTTMKVVDVSNCGMSCKGAKSLARALDANSSLEELKLSDTSIGDEGVAHIADALQTNTTIKRLNVSNCGISCEGAKSLARALAANSSFLEELDISFNYIGDDGIAHIAIALQQNNSLKSLICTFYYDDTATDKVVLSPLAAALTTNTSIENLTWSSTHPDTTLKKMAECIKKSNLRELKLNIVTRPQPLGEPHASLEEAREWYRRVEVEGKEFILSLEDSRLESFVLLTHYNLHISSSIQDLQSQMHTSLEGAATLVNSKRKISYLPEIEFSVCLD